MVRLMRLSDLIRSGMSMLQEDMEKYPAFDKTKPYSEKNLYFNRANIIGIPLIHSGSYDSAEKYYSRMLETIRQFETQHSKIFNKGMVHANLGISQIGSDKIDQGFANLLKAFEEDEPFHASGYEPAFFQSPLFTQFESGIVDYVKDKAQLFASDESVMIDESIVSKLLLSLDIDNRFLFTVTIWNIRRNYEILINNDNTFTRGRLFSGIKDLCLFVEDKIRRKVKLKPGQIKMLKNLLDDMFSSEPWKSVLDVNWRSLTSAGDITNFESNLGKIFKITDVKARRFLLLGAVRNFSGHIFNVKGSYFFTRFDDIFKNILGTVFYLMSQGKL